MALFFVVGRPVRATMSDWKVMMIIAFHQNRVLAYQTLTKNTNVNFEVYLDFFSQVILLPVKQLQIRRPVILQDNLTFHRHSKVQDFFVRYRWEQLKHPPYSPDLNPCDYDGIYTGHFI